MERHPQRRLPSEVATHAQRRGRVQAPARNRGLGESGGGSVGRVVYPVEEAVLPD